MRMPLLRVDGLTVAYSTPRGEARALSDLHLDLYAGESVALIGESGSGKSTLGQALVGLLPPAARIVSGRVSYDGRSDTFDVLAAGREQLRLYRWAEAAYVAQSAINAFNPVQRIESHFRETADAHGGLRGSALHERSFALLRQVRLDPERVWRSYPHELSGGMRQRVLIALALLLSPRLLILDEPTTALDVLTQRSILRVLKDLRRDTDVAFIFISHDVGVAAEVSDRIVTMYAGRAVESGPSRAVLSSPRHPYTAGLMAAIPSLTADTEVVAIEGSPPDLVRLPPGCSFHPRCPRASARCRTGAFPEITVQPEHREFACHHPHPSAPPATVSVGHRDG